MNGDGGKLLGRIAAMAKSKNIEVPENIGEIIHDADVAARKEWSEDRKKSRQKHAELLLGQAGVPKRLRDKRFDGFSPRTREDEKNLNICQRYADSFTERVLPDGISMVFTGKTGTGKSHLAVAILQQVIDGGNTGAFITVDAMLRDIRSAYGSNEKSESELVDKYVSLDLLILDEVGIALGAKEKIEAQIFGVLNARYLEQKPTIVISNLSAQGISDYLGERLKSRLIEGGGPTLIFSGDDYRLSRSAI